MVSEPGVDFLRLPISAAALVGASARVAVLAQRERKGAPRRPVTLRIKGTLKTKPKLVRVDALVSPENEYMCSLWAGPF